MDIATPRGITVAALSLLVVTGLVPLGAASPPTDPGCPEHSDAVGRLSVSNPLSGQISASELVYFMANSDQEALERLNGVDAYVIDLGSDNVDRVYCLERSDENGGPYEFNVRFFSEDLRQIDSHDGDVDQDLLGKSIPDNSRYMVVELEQGPMINSFQASSGIGFYALEFHLKTYL